MCGLGGDGFGDAARELDAIDGQRVAGRHGRLVGDAQKSGAGAAHLLLQQPGRGVGRLALERVGADQFAEFGGLVGGRQARLAVDHGAHLVEVDLAAEARGGERGFRAGQAAADDANPHCASASARFAAWSGSAPSAKPPQRFAADAHVAPLVQELGAHGAIEIDGRRVPVQHLPLQAQAALFDGDGRDPLEQRLADAQAAKLGMHEKIFEVEPGPAHPGGVVEEVKGKAGRSAVVLGYQAEIEGVGSKAVAQQVGFGGGDGVRLALIGGQGANKGENLRNIGGGRGPNRGCHALIVGCDRRPQ